MVNRASKYLSGYTIDSDIANNELFPNPFAQDTEDDKSIAYDEDENIFKRKSLLKDNTYMEEDDEDEMDITQQSQGNGQVQGQAKKNHFKSNFDTDSETELPDGYSLRSSVIDDMSEGRLNGGDSGDRFKFLTSYQNIVKTKGEEKRHTQRQGVGEEGDGEGDGIPLQTFQSNTSSVFGISKLDDFNRFVRMTEINDAIYKKYDQRKPAEDNLLDVIRSTDLEQNYVENSDGSKDAKGDMKSRVSRTDRSRTDRSRTDRSRTERIKADRSKTDRSKDKKWYNIDWKIGGNGESSTVKNTDVYLGDESPASSSSEFNPRTNRYLSRKLKVRNLQMISFGGTLGVGLFLNSGKAITIAGGFGTLLSFIICGVIVLATIISFCEMVTFVSIVDGVSGLSSRFVDDAFGFAVGWLYFISFAFGLAGEIVASVIMLTYYPELKILENKGSIAGFVSLFLLSVVISNSINVQVFGEIEYISSFIKLIFILIMIICMIVLNRGGFGGEVLGFKYWNYSKSEFDHNLIFGLFRPSFNLNDTGTSDPTEGIGGNLGRFLSLLVAISVVSFAYSGTEIVCIAACEAKDPRKALPSATKRVFWRIVIFYCLSAFVVSLNLYAGDPRLLRFFSGSTGVSVGDFDTNYAIQYVGGAHCKSKSAVFAGYSSGSQSPWIVAFQSANICQLSSITNGFLVFFAVSCGNAQLYVSSRTMYSLSLQGKAPRIFSVCNRHGIPYYSVAFAASFGLLAFICVSEEATVVFQNLSNIIASSGIIVWFAMCLSFIRFYYGLKKRPDIISRDDPSYPYKSFFQPYSAFIGMIGSAIIILIMGYTVFLTGYWDTLAFFASYGTLIIFAICYVVYKFVYGTRIPSLETLDFDSGRREMDRFIWDGNKDYNQKSLKEVLHKWVSFLA